MEIKNKYKWICHNGFCNHIENVEEDIDIDIHKYKQCPECLDLMELILICSDEY